MDNFSSFCPLETRNSVFWSLWVSATFVFKFMKKYFQKIFFRAQNISGSIFHNSILNFLFPKFFHTKFSKNRHLKKSKNQNFDFFKKLKFWFFRFFENFVWKKMRKKFRIELWKMLPKMFCARKNIFYQYFFMNLKTKVALTHKLQKTLLLVSNGQKLAKLSHFFVRG